jgi:hypothetical protein
MQIYILSLTMETVQKGKLYGDLLYIHVHLSTYVFEVVFFLDVQ